MRTWLRVVVLVLAGLWSVATFPATHEAGHCALSWVEGDDGNCLVRFMHPSRWNEGVARSSLSSPWQHWVLYPVGAAAHLGSVLLVGLWALRGSDASFNPDADDGTVHAGRKP